MKYPSKKELLKMPIRKWNDVEKEYDEILLILSGRKHESGWMEIAIVGVSQEKFEICGFPDDISCFFPTYTFGGGNKFEAAKVRMDCLYPQGIIRYHTRSGKFTVSEALSSQDIRLKEPIPH